MYQGYTVTVYIYMYSIDSRIGKSRKIKAKIDVSFQC